MVNKVVANITTETVKNCYMGFTFYHVDQADMEKLLHLACEADIELSQEYLEGEAFQMQANRKPAL